MTGKDAVRAFIALDLPEPARRAAAEVSRALRALPRADAVRWVRPELLHVTLRFLGDVETQRLGPLVECVGAELAEVSPFALELGGVQVFPPRRPRVVALHLHPEETLGALAAAVERGAVTAGFPAEERPFRAHLTLGRVRGRRGPHTAGVGSPPPAPWDVAETVLFRSRLGSDGPRYTPLERIALGGGSCRGAKRPRSEP
jgi:2'-5' RNA ligase